MFIDAHAHLDREYFKKETPEAILRRAFEAGVDQLVVVGLGLKSARNAVELAQAHPGRIFAAVGIHPHDVAKMSDADFDVLAELAARPEVVAVGETGLDYHYDHSPREVQREAFARFCRLAKTLGKPLVVHTREAEPDTVAILEAEAPFPAGGQIHSFTGTLDLARPAVDLGFHVSLSGVFTFANAEPLREAVRTLPPERLLVETDCPYLTPAPFRGRKNEPRYVTATAGALARLLGRGVVETAALTTGNTRRLFRLPEPPKSDVMAFASGAVLHVAVHRDDVVPEALVASAASWPIEKIERVVALVSDGAEVRPELVAAVAAWAREAGRPFEGP